VFVEAVLSIALNRAANKIIIGAADYFKYSISLVSLNLTKSHVVISRILFQIKQKENIYLLHYRRRELTIGKGNQKVRTPWQRKNRLHFVE
tara:strand:- start:1267 stop:1539 length:273 start_codon:yes stop_codon:yes gene_type:complete